MVEPHLFVVLGGTGDLMRRKLLPALYHLRDQGHLHDSCLILGVDLKDLKDEDFRAWARSVLTEADLGTDSESWCDHCLSYHYLGNGTREDYGRLAEHIQAIERAQGLPGNRVFYLALPPAAFPGVIEGLGDAGLNKAPGWVRVVVEKPFGHDLDSARQLNVLIYRFFDESSVYRIDHYLGKETVQNLLAFRFGNPIFESLWNRDRVESVQITVAEDIGVGHRGAYYDKTGALRDMVQNHLTQLTAIVAMEIPVEFEAEAIRTEKLKVLRATAPVGPDDVAFGQYTAWSYGTERIAGYREEPGVPPDSLTETFVSMKLEINTWRWQGVPFYLRTGKRMPRKLTQVAVIFRKAPIALFRSFGWAPPHSNILVINLQPHEGFSICFDVKTPGKPFRLDTRALHFNYQEAFGPLPDAYQTLLLDLLAGDRTLFVRGDLAEASWCIYNSLLKGNVPVHLYSAFTWGPKESDELLARQGHHWQLTW